MLCPDADLLLGRALVLDEDERVVTTETDAGELEVEYENLVGARRHRLVASGSPGSTSTRLASRTSATPCTCETTCCEYHVLVTS
jgi:hypothetical protein